MRKFKMMLRRVIILLEKTKKIKNEAWKIFTIKHAETMPLVSGQANQNDNLNNWKRFFGLDLRFLLHRETIRET